MLLGAEESAVRAGDCVVIAPGTEHQLVNDGSEPLVCSAAARRRTRTRTP
jgi:mannose-6-phosphate isomerase-like protein (cupin superfamily)